MSKEIKIHPMSKRFRLALHDMPDVMKDTNNSFTKKKYASLKSVLDAVKPVLANHHLTIRQETRILVDTHMMYIKTFICDASLNTLEDDVCINEMILPEKVDDKNPAHSLGKSITYCRRYSLLVALNIVADDDDDGNRMSRQQVDVPKKDERSIDQFKTDCLDALKNAGVELTDEIKKAVVEANDKATIKSIYAGAVNQ